LVVTENYLLLDDDHVSGVDKCRYFGVLFNKNGDCNEEINNRINKGRNITRSLNSILWDEKLRKIKKRMRRTVVRHVTMYEAEAWDENRKNGNKPLATEMDCVRKSWRGKRLGRIRNEAIREMMEMEKDIIDEVQKRQLMCFGDTNIMDETGWPREVLRYAPLEMRKRGRLRQGWRDDIEEQWKQETSLKKALTEGKIGGWGQRKGDSCKIIRKYVYTHIVDESG
jgi:hypothetical protein